MSTLDKTKNRMLVTIVTVSVLSVSIIGAMVPSAYAAPKQVEYTFTIADLGQGVWGGGSLFDDGSAGGNVAFSAGNGQAILQFQAVSWEEVNDGEAVDICFETRYIKDGEFFPPEFCTSDIGEPLPVTGEPLIADGFLFRVTPAGN